MHRTGKADSRTTGAGGAVHRPRNRAASHPPENRRTGAEKPDAPRAGPLRARFPAEPRRTTGDGKTAHAPPERRSRSRRDQPDDRRTGKAPDDSRAPLEPDTLRQPRDSPRDDDSRPVTYNVDNRTGRAQKAPETHRDTQNRRADRDGRRRFDALRAAENARERQARTQTTGQPHRRSARAERDRERRRRGDRDGSGDFLQGSFSSPAETVQNNVSRAIYTLRRSIYVYILRLNGVNCMNFKPRRTGFSAPGAVPAPENAH